jgi:hypothetical protein
MMNNNGFKNNWFFFLLVAPLFVGCAHIHPENMVPEKTIFNTQHECTIALNVSSSNPEAAILWLGGGQTMKPEEFQEAIGRSIKYTKLFRQIANPSSADYILSVELKFAGSHPGFGMHAWVLANWSLSERVTGAKVWAKDAKGDGHADASEAFDGGVRQVLAIERAAKDNIDTALTEVGNLHLKPCH